MHAAAQLITMRKNRRCAKLMRPSISSTTGLTGTLTLHKAANVAYTQLNYAREKELRRRGRLVIGIIIAIVMVS